MNLFSKIFTESRPSVECQRCLGKGRVDWEDIKRMHKELKWIPGTCAYCNGAGKVHPEIEKNLPVDTTYLVNDLPAQERKQLINGNPDALERAFIYEEKVNDFIDQICFLHFQASLKPSIIAAFYLLAKKESESYQSEVQELTESIERLIEAKSREN